jgi:peptidoglycan/LPS O-acetylase OafA/YrhL
MEAIAARSYSLYLVHIPVYFGAHEIWYRFHKLAIPSRPQAVVIVVLAAVAVACVAELNHRLLERPLRARGRQLAADFQARRLVATP